MTLPQPVILYMRAECHLCDRVIRLLEQAGIPWRPADIAGDPALEERYGLRIPVLQRTDTGAELIFPFGEEELRLFSDQ